MKGFIQQIKDGDNVVHLNEKEQKMFFDFFRLFSEIPISKCHSAMVNISEDGYICTYCGEVCEMNETP